MNSWWRNSIWNRKVRYLPHKSPPVYLFIIYHNIPLYACVSHVVSSHEYFKPKVYMYLLVPNAYITCCQSYPLRTIYNNSKYFLYKVSFSWSYSWTFAFFILPLTTLYQLYRLYIAQREYDYKWWNRKIWKEALVAYLKMIFQHLSGRTEENFKISPSGSSRLRIVTEYSKKWIRNNKPLNYVIWLQLNHWLQ